MEFNYIIRNFEEDISFLKENYSLRSIGKNEVNGKPIITQDKFKKNFYRIQMPLIKANQEFINGLFKLYFTDTINIPLELSGKIRKPEYKVLYYNSITDIIEENVANVYVYRHQYKRNSTFEIEMHFRLQIFDKKKHKFEIILPSDAYYPENDIQFYLKGRNITSKRFHGDIEEFIDLPVIAKFPPNYKSYKSLVKKYFTFIIDNSDKKDIIIHVRKEENKSKNPNKFFEFPYKTLINGEYKIIDNDNKKEIIKQEFPILVYSPFNVLFYKLVPDTIVTPGKIINENFLEKFQLIAFMKNFNDYYS